MSSRKMKFYKKFCILALHNAAIYQIKLNIRLHSLYNLYSVSVQGLIRFGGKTRLSQAFLGRHMLFPLPRLP